MKEYSKGIYVKFKPEEVYVNKLMVDIELYFPVSADSIPVSRKSHIIKQLFLYKMGTLLNYSFYKFWKSSLKESEFIIIYQVA